MANKVQTGLIYRVKSPSNKSYVGQTIQDLSIRKYRHYQDALNGKISHLY